MPTSNTVIIFQKPELYFFPHYKNLVYAPFSVPEGSMRYYLYRFLHLLRLPGYSHFWGAWKEQLSSAEQVIRDFLEKPFVPYSEAVLDSYNFEHWKAQF